MLAEAGIGDLVYIPGHVMLVIGHYDGVPYVIHDVTGVGFRAPDDSLVRIPLNGVSVTPLTPLRLSLIHSFVDEITHIVQMRP